jgi:5,10-methylenetetrahydromethanopterin reductase
MAKLEMYLRSYPMPDEAATVARTAEAEGWDGLLYVDTQNLLYDTFAALYLGAAATSRVRLGTAVTNPVTRHPAVLAGAFATLQHVSAGRAYLGIGRGDTALQLIGEKPPSAERFAALLAQLQASLRGETVELNGFPSRITWLPEPGLPGVPVDVFASGPRMIDVAARLGDRVTLALGAEPARMRWGIERARAARQRAGLARETLSIGAMVIVAVGPDPAALRELVRANASVSAHFQRGSLDVLSAEDRAIVVAITRDYDQYRHGTAPAPQARELPGEFIDRFTVTGPPDHCAARLRELVALGLDHLVVVGAARDVDPAIRHGLDRLFAAEVLPALRAS